MIKLISATIQFLLFLKLGMTEIPSEIYVANNVHLSAHTSLSSWRKKVNDNR